MSALFYTEELGIPIDAALKVSRFMEFCHNQPAVKRASPWVRGDMVRVYVDFWSQNSLRPFDLMYDKNYYNPVDNEFYLSGSMYQRFICCKLSMCSKWKSGAFSGAQTRKKIQQFTEDFYSEKTNWN